MRVLRKIEYFYILMLMMVLPLLNAKAQDVETTPVDYVVVLPADSIPTLSDSTFYSKSFAVRFPVNKYTLPKNNIFNELHDVVLPWAKRNDLTLSIVDMRGASSPEGPRKWNETLAKRRLNALYNEIDSLFHYGNKQTKIVTRQEAEAYAHLCFLMRQAGDRDAARVTSLVDMYSYNMSLLKKKLMALDGGKLWKRLLKEYYHKLRDARVLLYFNASPDVEEETVVEETVVDVAVVGNVADAAETAGMDKAMTMEEEETPVEIYENRREVFAIKTNLLEWGAWVPQYGMCPMPNVAVEYYPTEGHVTFGASFDCPWWMNGKETHKYFALRNFQLEARYYLRNSVQSYLTGGAAFRGLYFSAYAHIFMYQIGFTEKKGWQGEGEGGGLGIGYMLPLTRNGHWRLDFNLQVGAFNTKYDPYVYGCPVENVKDGYYYYDFAGQAADFHRREYSLTWIGPTRIGVTISYDLFYRLNHRRGLSLRNKEKGVQR